MRQQLTALRVTSDEFFQNSFFESKIAISTLQFSLFLLDLRMQFLHSIVVHFFYAGMMSWKFVQIENFSMFSFGILDFLFTFAIKKRTIFKDMRKVHIIMFGCHLVIMLAFSMLLLGGVLGAETFLAFVYPVISFIFLIADIFFTTFTTDLIIHFKKEARILLIIIRDITIVLLCFWMLSYLKSDFILTWGTLSYAFPKIIKIILCDIINRQKYLDKFINI